MDAGNELTIPGEAPPTRAFLEACARAGVDEPSRSRLWRLHQTRPPSRPAAAHLEALLADFAHWRLFALSREGDHEAARRFERYWRQRVRKSLGPDFTFDQVDEVAAIFFERVYRKGGEFAWKGPFAAWLQALLLNITRDEIRRLSRARARRVEAGEDDRRPEPMSADPDPERQAMAREDVAAVERALASLGPVDRHIVVRCLLEEESGQDLARELGISRDALYQRLSRAKRLLRRILAAAEPRG